MAETEGGSENVPLEPADVPESPRENDVRLDGYVVLITGQRGFLQIKGVGIQENVAKSALYFHDHLQEFRKYYKSLKKLFFHNQFLEASKN